jgi:hypothetical protein
VRTPDFNVTQHGLEFLVTPTPARYAELYESYRLEELAIALSEIGQGLWSDYRDATTGNAVCAECQAEFDKTSAKKL